MPAVDPDFERELVCTRCGRKVIVAELPERHLDALGYVCGTCLEAGQTFGGGAAASSGGNMSENVLQIVAAPPGWRLVAPFVLEQAEDLEALPDNHLYHITPIACFALVEDSQQDWRTVQPVLPIDWPAYLSVSSDNDDVIGFLAPGEEPDQNFRKEAINQITLHREKVAARRAKTESDRREP